MNCAGTKMTRAFLLALFLLVSTVSGKGESDCSLTVTDYFLIQIKKKERKKKALK